MDRKSRLWFDFAYAMLSKVNLEYTKNIYLLCWEGFECGCLSLVWISGKDNDARGKCRWCAKREHNYDICSSDQIPIIVGKLIFSQIHLSFNNNLDLYFPIIINELCIQAGVEFHDDDEWLQPMKPVDDFHSKVKKGKRCAAFLMTLCMWEDQDPKILYHHHILNILEAAPLETELMNCMRGNIIWNP